MSGERNDDMALMWSFFPLSRFWPYLTKLTSLHTKSHQFLSCWPKLCNLFDFMDQWLIFVPNKQCQPHDFLHLFEALWQCAFSRRRCSRRLRRRLWRLHQSQLDVSSQSLGGAHRVECSACVHRVSYARVCEHLRLHCVKKNIGRWHPSTLPIVSIDVIFIPACQNNSFMSRHLQEAEVRKLQFLFY